MSEKVEAARLVAKLVRRHGAVAVAGRLAITEGAVRSHAEGRATPRKKLKARYLEVYEVPVDAWGAATTERGSPKVSDTEPAPGAPRAGPQRMPPAPLALPDAPAETDALRMVARLLATAQEQLELARGDTDVPYNARATLITSATRLCQLLARLSGQLEITQAAILRSSAWSRILRTFESVFERHPEAQAALAEFAAELEGLGQ